MLNQAEKAAVLVDDLESAAKAMRFQILNWAASGPDVRNDQGNEFRWTPHICPESSIEMQCELKIDIKHVEGGVTATAKWKNGLITETVSYGSDPIAAVMTAALKVAAGVGRRRR